MAKFAKRQPSVRKAAECSKHVHVVEEASLREVEEVEVGGVWMVGGVMATERFLRSRQ